MLAIRFNPRWSNNIHIKKALQLSIWSRALSISKLAAWDGFVSRGAPGIYTSLTLGPGSRRDHFIRGSSVKTQEELTK